MGECNGKSKTAGEREKESEIESMRRNVASHHTVPCCGCCRRRRRCCCGCCSSAEPSSPTSRPPLIPETFFFFPWYNAHSFCPLLSCLPFLPGPADHQSRRDQVPWQPKLPCDNACVRLLLNRLSQPLRLLPLASSILVVCMLLCGEVLQRRQHQRLLLLIGFQRFFVLSTQRLLNSGLPNTAAEQHVGHICRWVG